MNMSARIALVGAVSIALIACGPRGTGGTGGGTGTGGSSGAGGGGGTGGGSGSGGNTGGGSGTGGNTGGGSGTGGNTGGGSGATGGGSGATGGGMGGLSQNGGQVAHAKDGGLCAGGMNRFLGVVVTAIGSTSVENGTGNIRQNVWVTDPVNPAAGLYLFKNYSDVVNGMNNVALKVGDQVNIDGWLVTTFGNSGINAGAEAYRYVLEDGCPNSNTSPMQIVLLDAGVNIPDIEAPAPWGLNADGGKPRGYFTNDQKRIQPVAGARIHIPGPLTLSNPDPVETHEWFGPPGGTSFGFEVSGASIPAGVLVRTSNVFGTFPDGGPRCDFGQAVRDGGRTVTWPTGIRGVWDTWTQTPCYNGTDNCAFNQKDAGLVPGLLSNYTFAIFPLDCNDLAGAVVTP